ncbi:hypothetical protein Purlil1_2762 [Purpureocillium lilacinum]|uniref:Uncharacterized protein n=1 Tax=Purpureocillium lilacinum TaxID=33203 RepID=A0ABR0C991_PURLI|nr:hypothetical protein Purlil1_2762 [Purpureocillium lilacinum]
MSVPTVNKRARHQPPRPATIASLDDTHREALLRAIGNVASCGVAKAAFGQIADGLPLSEVDRDTYDGTASRSHPLHSLHRTLRPEAAEKAEQFRTAGPRSWAFNTCLVELVAVSIHQIAALLHGSGPGSDPDKGRDIKAWTAPRSDAVWWYTFPDGPPATLLRHKWYCDYEQCPRGVADGVGYWAEGRIFGGVVLFDRREPASAPAVDSESIYLHPDRHDVTYRIVKLLDEQKQALVQFLLAGDEAPVSCPLPIIVDSENRYRVDPEEDMRSTGIYRDLWERKPWPDDAWDYRLRDVFDSLNWVTEQDWLDSAARAMDRKIRIDEEQFGGDDSE